MCLSIHSRFDKNEDRPRAFLHQLPFSSPGFTVRSPSTALYLCPLTQATPLSSGLTVVSQLRPLKLHQMALFAFKIVYFFLALVAIPHVLASTDAISKEALTGHNSFRALHGASPLTWNKDLAAAAQSWVSRCVFEHSGGKVGAFGGTSFGGSFPVTKDTHV